MLDYNGKEASTHCGAQYQITEKQSKVSRQMGCSVLKNNNNLFVHHLLKQRLSGMAVFLNKMSLHMLLSHIGHLCLICWGSISRI